MEEKSSIFHAPPADPQNVSLPDSAVVLLLTEVTKMLVEQMKSGSWHARLFHPGGMPSSHSAFVTSLLIIVGGSSGLVHLSLPSLSSSRQSRGTTP